MGHLEAILTYVAAFDRAAATRLAQRLIEVADSLAKYSERGRDAGNGLREMTTVWPYIIRYRLEEGRVVMLRIRHGAQDENSRHDLTRADSRVEVFKGISQPMRGFKRRNPAQGLDDGG